MPLSDVLGLLAGSFGAGLSEYGQIQQQKAAEQKKREDEFALRRAVADLYGGRMTPEQAALSGIPTATISAGIRATDEPKVPTVTVVPYMGGTARMKDGVFDSWVLRPPSEREPGPTPADIRSLRSELGRTEEGFRSTMRARPLEGQFPTPERLGTDTAAFNRAMANWRADSTYAAGRRAQAAEELARATGQPFPSPSAPVMVPNAAQQRQLAQDAQEAIRRIMASSLSETEKANRIQQVNTRLRAALSTQNP